MGNTADLMRANLLEVFNERDPDRRAAAIVRTYAPDVLFSDPDETVIGHEAIGADIAIVRDGLIARSYTVLLADDADQELTGGQRST